MTQESFLDNGDAIVGKYYNTFLSTKGPLEKCGPVFIVWTRNINYNMDHNNLEILGLCMRDGENNIYQVMDFDDSDGTVCVKMVEGMKREWRDIHEMTPVSNEDAFRIMRDSDRNLRFAMLGTDIRNVMCDARECKHLLKESDDTGRYEEMIETLDTAYNMYRGLHLYDDTFLST